MYLDTNYLFQQILKLVQPYIILDIGSRDGKEALLFSRLCPSSHVVAYEANPYLFQKLLANTELAALVHLRHAAVTSFKGRTDFFIAKADYDREENVSNNHGQSSLLTGMVEAQEKIEVEATTVSEELHRLSSGSRTECALWIDVEGAEGDVIRGIASEREQVAIIHVECATRPRWNGQATLHGLSHLLGASFINIGHTSTIWRGWGDAVFVRTPVFNAYRDEIRRARRRALMRWFMQKALRINQGLRGRP